MRSSKTGCSSAAATRIVQPSTGQEIATEAISIDEAADETGARLARVTLSVVLPIVA